MAVKFLILDKQYHLTSDTRCGNYNPTSQRLSSWKCGCFLLIDAELILYLSIQIVIQSILVIHVWDMMDKDRRILLTFFGLLFSTTIAALALFILLNPVKTPNHFYLRCCILWNQAVTKFESLESIIYKCIATKSKTDHVADVPRFSSLFLPAEAQLDVSIMSITVTRMLLRLRKQAVSDSSGQVSVEECSLTTFRAVSGETSSEVAG
ncbi:hypothetical protein EV421DRAFT_1742165 [Armillaria borealis]|uniref:Uncharacterized protein n=1 Tax=Armillaria borealis TaxID=47425 RepID=A0AA39IZX3_9AGAR|nr:hypothetical protein EV421DRAFT_1742165 [Armillaria borealis]